jgi:Flp pilus assembly protein TadD/predicted GIY-YIG superfamily endonuclease
VAEARWWVYVLTSNGGGRGPRRTYVGSTVDPERRMLQHNGQRPGGAARTRAGRPWRLARLHGPFPDRSAAQRVEARLKKQRGRARLAALATLVAWLLQACGDAPRGTPGDAPRRAAYADDASCSECHSALARSYAEVAMARSLYRPSADTAIEDFAHGRFYHAASDRHYEMELVGDDYVFRQYQLDGDGHRVHAIERTVAWIVGSGNHARSYLFQTELGELFQLPLCWYTQEGRWDMAPGFEFADQQGFTRLVPRDCIGCHDAYPDLAPGADRYGEPYVFPAELPHGIGCQRCHGPGAEHVRLAADLDAPLEAVRGSIVNPARLAPGARDQVCLQCHLQPTARHTSIVHAFGRGEYSFVPGEDLGEHAWLVDFGAEGERFEINHHAYRLRQSRCFVASASSSTPLACLTCHDPHRKVRPQELAAHYRAKCHGCHAQDACGRPGEPGHAGAGDVGDCVACHMPPRRPEDVVRVTLTDHRIQRAPPREDYVAPLLATRPDMDVEPVLYGARDDSTRLAAVYLASAAVRSGMHRHADGLRAALERARPDGLEPYVDLAQSLLGAGRFDESASVLARLVREGRDAPVVRTGLGYALAAQGRAREALAELERALELEPRSVDARFGLGSVLLQLGHAERARAELEQTLRLRPNHAGAHLMLARLHAQAGRHAEALAALELSLAVEPRNVEALLELCSLLVGGERHGAALARLELARRTFPEDPRVAEAQALAFMFGPDPALQDPVRALLHARRGVELAPASAAAALTLALALARAEDWPAVTGQARQARGLGADGAACLALEAAAAARAGRLDEARAAWERAQELAASPAPASMARAMAWRVARSALR